MKVRTEPCIDVMGLSTELDKEAQHYLNDHACAEHHIKKVSGDFAYIPKRIEFFYELNNGHIVRIAVEEFV